MTECAIFTNLCMISDGKGNVLVQDRRKEDWRGVTFPGGHVLPGESFTASVIREVWEETGLVIEDPVLCGVKQFPTDTGARYVVLCYRAEYFTGALHSSEEGDVFWVRRDELASYPLAPDLMPLLTMMESDTLSEFYLYREGAGYGKKIL
ncbi:MAG: 8-oxo-dGTP diphosphatase [Clostridia bacterium]|nr:8-oxo-dGTP diphosphatase [Clostridia bacterium]